VYRAGSLREVLTAKQDAYMLVQLACYLTLFSLENDISIGYFLYVLCRNTSVVINTVYFWNCFCCQSAAPDVLSLTYKYYYQY